MTGELGQDLAGKQGQLLGLLFFSIQYQDVSLCQWPLHVVFPHGLSRVSGLFIW